MKKIWIVVALAACVIALAGCKIIVSEPEPVVIKPEPITVESVTLDATTLTLALGTTRKLTATVNPDNANDKTVAWSSSDTLVATVDNNGTVMAVKEGTAIIIAQVGGMTAECIVTVEQISVPVTGITLNRGTLTLNRDEKFKLTATVLLENVDDKTVAWSSSDTSVATVGNDGTVTAVKVGTAKITARAGGKEATCAVTVNPISVASIMLDKNALTLETNMTGKLTATVTPSNADDTTVTWSSSDTLVATVDNSGTVTAVKAGTATIIAKAGDKTAECTLTVRTDHSWSGGKCTLCGAKPSMEKGTIDENGVLTKYTGTETTVTIPDGVTGIGKGAFKDCTSLKSVTIPDSVTSIEYEAFYGCNGLTSVTIPDSVTRIGHSVFDRCTSLESVAIPSSVTRIEENAFSYCRSLTSITIPDSVTFIGSYAFYYCTSLTSITIPDGVTRISSYAFQFCTNLESVTIPDSVTEFGWEAFLGCESLKSVKIPNGMTTIGSDVFCGCYNLTSVDIPSTVTTIDTRAFRLCKSLDNVKIPNSVTEIGLQAFADCTNLNNVSYDGTIDEWKAIKKWRNIFDNTKVKEITDKNGNKFTIDTNGNITN